MRRSFNRIAIVLIGVVAMALTSCSSYQPSPELETETPTEEKPSPTEVKETPMETPSPGIILENAHISILLDRSNGSILQVEEKESGLQLIKDPVNDLPPWRLTLFDPSTGAMMEIEKWEDFTISSEEMPEGGERAHLLWELGLGLEIRAQIDLPVDNPNIEFFVEVRNESKVTVQQIEFPVIRGIGRLVESRPEDNLLLHPVAGGLLFVDPLNLFPMPPVEARGLRHIPYPEGVGAFTQFMAYYAKNVGGFYFACHDPWNTTKEVDFYWPPEIKGLETLFAHKAWDMEPGNSLVLDYPILLGALQEGSWYEAAERYRDWATTTGEGHPEWAAAGRLEDRVEEGKAAKWLAEEVGFSTFGAPSSFDVSPWLEAFHQIAEKPIFHVLGHDWPQWGGASIERMERLDAMFLEAGLKPFHEHSLNELWFPHIAVPLDLLGSTTGNRQFFEMLGAQWSNLPPERWEEIFNEYNCCGPWLHPDTNPLAWFPTQFHPANLQTIKSNGDYFVPFFFDFFSYGHDHTAYGLNQGSSEGWQQPHELIQAAFTRNWMDPTTSYWQNFHAERDRKIVEESGADGLYYDISAGAGPRWSDRDDLGHPIGYGRWLWDGYAETYQKSKEAASEAKGAYIVQGTEMGLETLIPYIDFCQWRAGGLVQGDIELMPYMDLVEQGKAIKLPLFSYLYHEYGPVMLDGWAKLSPEFGDIFYLIAAQIALQQGGLVELNYEYSPLERFPGMEGPTYQLMYHTAIYEDTDPYEVDPGKIRFLGEIALARTEFGKEYLAYGKAMKPVQILNSVPTIDLSWNHYNSIGGRRASGVFPAPSIVQQVWKYRDEKLGILLVNIDPESTLEVELIVAPVDYGLKADRYTVKEVTSSGEQRSSEYGEGEEIRVSVSLPSRRIMLIEVVPKTD